MGRCFTPNALVTIAAFDHDELDGVSSRGFPLSRTQKFVVSVMSDLIMPSVLLAGCAAAARRRFGGPWRPPYSPRAEPQSLRKMHRTRPAHSKRAGLSEHFVEHVVRVVFQFVPQPALAPRLELDFLAPW